MKKSIAISISALLILSVLAFAVMADDSNPTADNEKSPVLEKERQGKGAGAELKNDVRQRLTELKKINAQRKVDIEGAKKAFDTAKENLAQTKLKLADCTGKNDDTCKQARADAKLASQETLLATADQILANLNAVKDRLSVSNVTTTSMDDKITLLQTVRAKIASLTENSTKQEISDAAKSLKTAWQSARDVIKLNSAKVAAGEMQAVLDSVTRLKARLDEQISKAKTAGADTSKIDALVADFNTLMTKAQSQVTAAKSVAATANVGETAKMIQDQLKLAKESVKQANSKLKEIVKELKPLKAPVNASNS